MPSSLPIQRYDRYQIIEQDGWFYLVNQDATHVIAKAKSYNKAVNHLMSCTGKYSRCSHKWLFNGQKGSLYDDRYLCGICGKKKIDKRILKRKESGPKDGEATKRQRRRREADLRRSDE